jgi:hypothetical protein
VPAVLTPPRVIRTRLLRPVPPAPPLPPLTLPPAVEGEPDGPRRAPARARSPGRKGLPLRACVRCRVVRPVAASGVCRGCRVRGQGEGG